MGKKSLVEKRERLLDTITMTSKSQNVELLIGLIIYNTGKDKTGVHKSQSMEAMAEIITPLVENLSEEELLKELQKLPQYPTKEQLEEIRE